MLPGTSGTSASRSEARRGWLRRNDENGEDSSNGYGDDTYLNERILRWGQDEVLIYRKKLLLQHHTSRNIGRRVVVGPHWRYMRKYK
jgi:hypothetical protein